MGDCRLLYLHGFVSSPRALKATLFAKELAARGVTLEVPDLNLPSFADLTLSRQLEQLDELTRGQPAGGVVLIGSSLGGYAAALQAARSEAIGGLVLLAPAFDFRRRWAEKLGSFIVEEWRRRNFMLVFHNGTGQLEPIHYSLLEDAARHPAFPPPRVATLLFHGRRDEVVDPAGSERYAAEHPELVELELLDDDHGLATSAGHIVERSLRFLARWFPSLV
jgi:uncharacterized protein